MVYSSADQGKIVSKCSVTNEFKAFIKSWWPTDRLPYIWVNLLRGKKTSLSHFEIRTRLSPWILMAKPPRFFYLMSKFLGSIFIHYRNFIQRSQRGSQSFLKTDKFLPDSIALSPCQDVNCGPFHCDNSKILALTLITTFFAGEIQFLNKWSKIQPSWASHRNGTIYILNVQQPMPHEQKE